MDTNTKIKSLININQLGYYQIDGLLNFGENRLELHGFLKVASVIKAISKIATDMGIKLESRETNYLRLSTLKKINAIILFSEDSKAIYLHPGLIDIFLHWIHLSLSLDLIHHLKLYKSEIRQKKNKHRNLKYTTYDAKTMVSMRLRGESYSDIAKKFYFSSEQIRAIILKTAAEADIKIPKRNHKKK